MRQRRWTGVLLFSLYWASEIPGAESSRIVPPRFRTIDDSLVPSLLPSLLASHPSPGRSLETGSGLETVGDTDDGSVSVSSGIVLDTGTVDDNLVSTPDPGSGSTYSPGSGETGSSEIGSGKFGSGETFSGLDFSGETGSGSGSLETVSAGPAYEVAITFTIAADIATFDTGAFKTKLAAKLKVGVDAVTLTVKSASIIVIATISYALEVDANAGAAILAEMASSPASASATMGVAIISVTMPIVSALMPPALPPSLSPPPALSPSLPPPASPTAAITPDKEGGNTMDTGTLTLIILIAVIGVLLLTCVVVAVVVRARARKVDKVIPGTVKEASFVPPAYPGSKRAVSIINQPPAQSMPAAAPASRKAAQEALPASNNLSVPPLAPLPYEQVEPPEPYKQIEPDQPIAERRPVLVPLPPSSSAQLAPLRIPATLPVPLAPIAPPTQTTGLAPLPQVAPVALVPSVPAAPTNSQLAPAVPLAPLAPAAPLAPLAPAAQPRSAAALVPLGSSEAPTVPRPLAPLPRLGYPQAPGAGGGLKPLAPLGGPPTSC